LDQDGSHRRGQNFDGQGYQIPPAERAGKRQTIEPGVLSRVGRWKVGGSLPIDQDIEQIADAESGEGHEDEHGHSFWRHGEK
jgi:hypothetical protein